MNKTAAVLGAIWGIFAMVFSLFLFLVIFAPEATLSGDLAPFGNSVLTYYDGASFGAAAWAIAIGTFGLAALGLIGSGLVRHRHFLAGILLLVSTVGMLVVCFQPFLVGEYSVLDDFTGFFQFGPLEQILVVLLTVLITLLGFLSSLFSLVTRPKLAAANATPAPTAAPPVFAEPATPVPATVVPAETIPPDAGTVPAGEPVSTASVVPSAAPETETPAADAQEKSGDEALQ